MNLRQVLNQLGLPHVKTAWLARLTADGFKMDRPADMDHNYGINMPDMICNDHNGEIVAKIIGGNVVRVRR